MLKTHTLKGTIKNKIKINEGDVINEMLDNSIFPSDIVKHNKMIGVNLYPNLAHLIQIVMNIVAYKSDLVK